MQYDETATSATSGTPEERVTTVAVLETDTAYSLLPIVSPQFQLSGQLTSASYKNYDIVYRMVLRGWITFASGVTIPSLSNINVMQIGPNLTTEGTGVVPSEYFDGTACSSSTITPVSGTVSSAAGAYGITFQPVSQVDTWLKSTDKHGTEIPVNVASGLPRSIIGYGDYQANYPYISATPKYDFSVVFNTSDTIRGTEISELLESGYTRISYDEGASWSTWTTMSERNAYIDPSLYLGTGTQPKYPGQAYTFNGVTTPMAQCNGIAALATNMNAIMEMSFSIVS
jgi:hypothetical protein